MIGFNKPYITGKEFEYIQEAIKIEKLSGNGYFTKRCQELLQKKYSFKKVLLTHSCTAALEMAALLIEIQPGDEVIIPSYTFVSTANAFLLRGASIIFADSNDDNPNINVNHVKTLITKKTKAVVVVHYAGIACDMDPIMQMAEANKFYVIEDAAQAIDGFYKGRSLGSIGHLAAFSFHETKNIICGEGGMLVVNHQPFIGRSEIIWEKGTNRAAFSRQEVKKYTWVDLGSSYLPSEITAAFLYAQLQNIGTIQARRKVIWQRYYDLLHAASIPHLRLPLIASFSTNNAHLFYLLTQTLNERDNLLEFLHKEGIQAIFHYLPLHLSPFILANHKISSLPLAEYYGQNLLRLPLYFEMTDADVDYIVQKIISFYLS